SAGRPRILAIQLASRPGMRLCPLCGVSCMWHHLWPVVLPGLVHLCRNPAWVGQNPRRGALPLGPGPVRSYRFGPIR
ncbi:MAG TPA: hypothetical protein VIL38_05060, partial [Thermaerobacter sp.]